MTPAPSSWRFLLLIPGRLVFLLGVVTSSLPAAPLIVAHRGASADAPENTLPAFELAGEQNADAIEGDFRLTSDGRVVCFHDADTKKITGQKLAVASSTLAELQGLDAGAWKDDRFRGTRIPTLAAVLATVPAGKQIFIEVKTGPEIVPALLADLDASGLDAAQVVIIAFDAAVVKDVKARRPELTANWLRSFDKKADCAAALPEILATLRRIKADGLGSNPHPTLGRAFVEAIGSAGFAHHIWTVDDPRVARDLLAIGIRSITTNTPGKMKTALSE
ncbi:MAG: glycerophosphodiester phosphodiesterase [Akkermansiaceae bacterium]|nr:glycerophosphodiester phosphodiesterase [Akkermansiaceae bacterium]